MKVDIRLEKVEKEALETISMSSCNAVSCLSCPFKYHDHDINICIKGVCQHLLEDYLNKD